MGYPVFILKEFCQRVNFSSHLFPEEFALCDYCVVPHLGSAYKRRGARRWKKLYRINGHAFAAKRLYVCLILCCHYFYDF